jgi:nitrogenase molybdenum-iron protein NifN
VATGTKSDRFASAVTAALDEVCQTMPVIRDDADFMDIEEEAAELAPDLLVGHSKGYKLARAASIPLIRVGFPIHDRFGGQRILHVGYEGALSLYDMLVNAVLEKSQDECPVGYGYL